MNQTTCPSCGHKFDAGAAIEKQLADKLKEQQETFLAQKTALEKTLNERFIADKEKFEIEIKKQVWAVAQQKAAEKTSAEMQQIKAENEAKEKALTELRNQEIELRRAQMVLKQEKDALKFEMDKQFLQKQAEIENNIKKQESEKLELLKKEFETKLEAQYRLIDEMKRKADQGSMQLQGEAQELLIENILQQCFPFDEVTEVKKGSKGADCILAVRDELGNTCGRIIFESKRTQHFSNDWIDKLKDDQRSQSAEVAVLVTQAFPKGMTNFGEVEGVWICNFKDMQPLVYALRKLLIAAHQSRVTQENRADKMVVLYNYLTGTAFLQQITAIVEGFKSLKEDLDKEKRAMAKIWKEREMAIDKVIDNTIDMYGAVRGIAGAAIAPIKYLELDPD